MDCKVEEMKNGYRAVFIPIVIKLNSFYVFLGKNCSFKVLLFLQLFPRNEKIDMLSFFNQGYPSYVDIKLTD